MTLPGFVTCPECVGTGETMESCKSLKARGLRQRSCVYGCAPHECPECGGAGQVLSPETVERVAEALYADDDHYLDIWESQPEDGVKEWYRKQARAALLGYARHVQEGEK